MLKKHIYSGPDIKIRDFSKLPVADLTTGEKVIRFAHDFLVVPEGIHVGKPLRLELFQQEFILAIFDNPEITRRAIMSIARRNGKTFIVAVILLAFIVGPLKVQNSTLASAALSRDQAALVFKLMSKMLDLSPRLAGLYRVVPSGKKIIGLKANVEYFALSSDAKTGHGNSLLVVLLDEAGQVRGPSNDFVEMLTSSQGSYESPLFITISTQAPSDADLLSTWIDDAQRTQDPKTVCHVYAADPDAELLDKEAWYAANPGLGIFRSEKDLEEQLVQASRLPSMEAGARNLLLNQRVSLEALYIAPSVWKSCASQPDLDVFRNNPCAFGLDLSLRTDLTAAVIAAQDEDGFIHILPYIFTPSQGLRDREARDKAPYSAWVRDGFMHTTPGAVVDYEWVCNFLKKEVYEKEFNLASVCFDRWRITEFQLAAERVGFDAGEYIEVGQGYQSMSPRLELFESILLQGQLKHGGHPLLNMAVANAVAVSDPSGNRKLDKSNATQRIDPLVACVMAVCQVHQAAEAGGSYLDGDSLLLI